MTNDLLGRVIKRYEDMRSERDRFLSEWDLCDIQYEAETFEDQNGKLYVNNPIEQNLIEMELGRTAGLPLYDVVPDGYRANVQELETAKYILEYYIEKEERWRENRQRKMDKAKYGTGIFFTGIRMDIETVPSYKEKEYSDSMTAFWDQKQMVEEQRTTRKFTPKNIPIRMFLMDDRAMRQPQFERVEDCVMLEFLTKEELELRYGKNKNFNQEEISAVVPSMIEEGEYGIQTRQPLVVLYHYFNKIDKTYAIVANKTNLIFDGKLIYPDGKLPFTVCQHYPNNSCLYGIGIPRKVRSEKAYTNNMQQYMIDGAKLSASKIIATGNSGEPVDGQIFAASGEISIARFSNGVEQLKDISTAMDLNGPLAVLNKMDDNIRKNTGIDLNSVFEPPADQLGTVEIIEENKQIRSKSVDELMDFAYQEVLTKMLKNLATFAPKLSKTEKVIKDKSGKVIKKVFEYPTLEIPNVTIDKKGVMKKDMGVYGYLDFTPETLDSGLAVRVSLGTTQNTKMKVIEKNKANELIGKYIELAQVFGPEKMEEAFPMEQVLQKWKVSYGLDDDKLVADTERDRIRQKNKEMLDALTELTQMSNAEQPQEEAGVPAMPGMPGGARSQEPTPMGIGEELARQVGGATEVGEPRPTARRRPEAL